MAPPTPTFVLTELRAALRRQKEHADRALAQLEPEDWHATLDPDANSIAVLVRHVAGNMRSRWTDFPEADGEKPDRDRDGEFTPSALPPEDLLAEWEEGWRVTLAALEGLDPDDLGRTVTVRGEGMPALRAIVRQIDHYGQHVGQILLLAKHRRGASWRGLSIPARRRV